MDQHQKEVSVIIVLAICGPLACAVGFAFDHLFEGVLLALLCAVLAFFRAIRMEDSSMFDDDKNSHELQDHLLN
ncbi:MAG: hypothetical protein CO186_08910 [Zetaproteobacteria bacterium CG_4_9_14_3_um_filter_49_83]|nr:MAG: hypothetical protein AUJ56_04450 [Zetaproteobacteria bacterium CG1_02_49_23]PIQ31660.1 MAG: hypothetical protein COW62_09255 [Zetaproteobacteria bacterium CG17_big_fil_post_rev_8_21_14_2_50_50_13]PIV31164.1 MAG: hypothetical protein COS35_02880 [Zetaproteobacteria bacterium CG02_land_8_20_14_3_00_50_9]PIY55526.1 MAG: hypothetical protein COZ00_09160 [Zetaproteobacteria bacterium CG_4_10_14_0_8_um_filter_49_80]PJA34882.1 MAG: hypothetical protein CO186_08910 [Zetaproteobacteria bacterium